MLLLPRSFDVSADRQFVFETHPSLSADARLSGLSVRTTSFSALYSVVDTPPSGVATLTVRPLLSKYRTVARLYSLAGQPIGWSGGKIALASTGSSVWPHFSVSPLGIVGSSAPAKGT